MIATALAGWLLRGGCGHTPSGIAESPAIALAVLPLLNLSGDKTQEFFADGMTEELITRLGQVAALRVTSRSSIMSYKGTSKSLREIARDLDVSLLVEGAVMRSGDQVRISAKVVEVAADRLIWSGSFDRIISDVLALQSDVAAAVVEVVKVRVTPQEESRLRASAATNPEAYESYLRGRELAATYTSEALQKANEAYQKSASIEPRFAPAHAGIASTYLALSSMYIDPAEAMPRAEAAATKALALDSTSAAGLAALAYVKGFYRFDWETAETMLLRAIALNRSDAFARDTYGYLLTVTGRFEESSREFRRAREIDPLSQVYAHHSLIPLYEGRRYGDAIREATSILRADPKAAYVRLIRAQAYSMSGDQEAAIQDITSAVATEPQPHLLAYLGLVLAKAGRRAAADSVFREFGILAKSAYIQPYTHAVVSLAKGDRSGALEWLEKGIEARTEEVVFLKVDPEMDPLRNDPRYQALLRRVGFGP